LTDKLYQDIWKVLLIAMCFCAVTMVCSCLLW